MASPQHLVTVISKAAKAPWNFDISHQDLQKFIKGSIPQDMDDKWLCQTSGPDTEGEYVVQFARTWTSHTVVALRVQAELDEGGAPLQDRPVRVHELLWETDLDKYNDPTSTSESMKTMARHLSKGLVQVELPDSN